jgi:hypothetical protein
MGDIVTFTPGIAKTLPMDGRIEPPATATATPNASVYCP